MSFQAEKEKFLQMSREEKRQHYKCKDYVTLEQVPTWPEWAEVHTLIPPKEDILFDYDKELNSKVSLWKGDITSLEVDVVVNPANFRFDKGNRGVCKEIFSAASSKLVEECNSFQPCKEGTTKITGGYKLPATYILHTVVPTNKSCRTLNSCYASCLDYLKKNGSPMPELRSIAFPCISTGNRGFPRKEAADIALLSTRTFLEDNIDKVDRIIFCLFTPEDTRCYKKLMQIYFPLKD